MDSAREASSPGPRRQARWGWTASSAGTQGYPPSYHRPRDPANVAGPRQPGSLWVELGQGGRSVVVSLSPQLFLLIFPAYWCPTYCLVLAVIFHLLWAISSSN